MDKKLHTNNAGDDNETKKKKPERLWSLYNLGLAIYSHIVEEKREIK